MATTKERILISLTPSEAMAIRTIAKRERAPRATIAARAIRAWLEEEEDRYLSHVGDSIAANPGRLYSHEEVWGRRGKKR